MYSKSYINKKAIDLSMTVDLVNSCFRAIVTRDTTASTASIVRDTKLEPERYLCQVDIMSG